MVTAAGSGHCAGALGMADVYAALYFDILRHNPEDPNWVNRDRLVLSCGHTAPVRYAAMAEAGYFPVEELLALRKLGSRLQGHPHRLDLPGLETSSGPLGQGLSQAIGMALAARLDNANWHTYAILSDGEHQEGATWEGVLFAAQYNLSNLTAIVDRNRIQISGSTESVQRLGSLTQKYRAFGWEAIEVDGNDLEAVRHLLLSDHAVDKPRVLIANTLPGKGVSFMEGDYHWHGKAPNQEEAARALAELGEEGM